MILISIASFQIFSLVISSVFFSQQFSKIQNITFKLLTLYDGGRYHIETSPLICGAKSMDWFLYDNGLRHERVTLHLKTI